MKKLYDAFLRRGSFQRKITFLAVILIAAGVSSCKKLIEIPPPALSMTDNNVFIYDNTAEAAIGAVYQQLMAYTRFDPTDNLSFTGGLSSDELNLYDINNTTINGYYLNALTPGPALPPPIYWTRYYNYLYKINTVIQGVSSSTTLTPAVKTQLLGEAYFMRAYFYFYLVNLYGDVPLVITTDPKVNATLARSDKVAVYAQIVSDLNLAKGMLAKHFVSTKDGFKGTSNERIRPTYWAAQSLLAKVDLYQGKYSSAEAEASEVIDNNGGLFSLPALDQAFIKNSSEAIWQLQAVGNNQANTPDGQIFVLSSTGPNTTGTPYSPVYLSNNVLSQFEPGDQRSNVWVSGVTVDGTTYYYPSKYKSGYNTPDNTITEYQMVFRLGELYLIRAEARARQGNTGGAVSDLNMLRTRARGATTVSVPDPLPNLQAGNLNAAQLIAAVEKERVTELFTEWGNRWFDLKRWPGINDASKSRADEVMPAVMTARGGVWKSTAQLYPIPYSEIEADINLKQNPGY